MINKVFNEDCLIGMQRIPDKSIDAIICDLPYGTTACKWDTVIPFEPLWVQYKRIIKDNGAIVLFGSQPFTSALVMSNPKWFRYEWIWENNRAPNFVFGNKQPLKKHENVVVFYSKQPTYNPQKTKNPKGEEKRHLYKSSATKSGKEVNTATPEYASKGSTYEADMLLPKSVFYFKKPQKPLHPTQKSVECLEYLVKTYTNEGDIVLDNCMGSGTTAIACINTNRNYIGFEMDKTYFDVINKRISDMPKPNKITNPSGVTKELWNWELYELKLKFEASSAYISWKGTDLGKNVDLFLNDMGYKIEVEAAL